MEAMHRLVAIAVVAPAVWFTVVEIDHFAIQAATAAWVVIARKIGAYGMVRLHIVGAWFVHPSLHTIVGIHREWCGSDSWIAIDFWRSINLRWPTVHCVINNAALGGRRNGSGSRNSVPIKCDGWRNQIDGVKIVVNITCSVRIEIGASSTLNNCYHFAKVIECHRA